MNQFLAHIRDDATEPLQAHLEETAVLAGAFASRFKLENTAKLAAKVHDFGKFSKEFQDYLRESAGDTEESDENRSSRSRGPDHSTAGAKFLAENFPQNHLGRLLAYTVAGHHAGLPNGISAGSASLEYRITHKEIKAWEKAARENLPADFFEIPNTDLIKHEILSIARNSKNPKLSLAFLVRMVFSCIVDADFLATEKFMNPGKSESRERLFAETLLQLNQRLTAYLRRFDNATSPLGTIRNEIRSDCLAAAELPPGAFRLTVPTGGGKTLSSLAFALKHAQKYGLERVIYVIPFTSIIEQNAEVFRNALGEDAILEHHCNVEIEESETTQSKLATENWDAPIIVTTNVQFFESLFSHKTSRSRKLHNIAKSVIILDEAQTLPIEFLRPCLQALDELVQNYGTSVVLCTATQPAIEYSEEKFKDGFRGNAHGIRDIVAAGRNLHERLKRVSVKKLETALENNELAQKLAQERQVLAIVNTRDNARELFESLRSAVPADEQGNVFHLSASMCAEHRNCILNTIRKKLSEGEVCRVVSTQLIEAGVDIDFPCVYRAQAGIDSIAQAAGRCNREGKIPNGGRVFIFETKKLPPAGFLLTASNCGKEVLALDEYGNDPLSEESVEKYFSLMYWLRGNELDKHGILQKMAPDSEMLGFRFRDAGEAFQLIEDNTGTVIIPFGKTGWELCEELRETFNPADRRKLSRKLQRYAVSIPQNRFEEALRNGQIQIVHERYALLVSPELHYNENFGLCLDKTPQCTPLFL